MSFVLDLYQTLEKLCSHIKCSDLIKFHFFNHVFGVFFFQIFPILPILSSTDQFHVQDGKNWKKKPEEGEGSNPGPSTKSLNTIEN